MAKTILATFAIALAFANSNPIVHSVAIHADPWIVTFGPSGDASAQFGSIAGDSGTVPEGTVDFTALVKAVTTSPQKTAEPGDIRVLVSREGEERPRVFVLGDDSFLRQLFRQLDSQWQPSPITLPQRFEDFLKQHPIMGEPVREKP